MGVGAGVRPDALTPQPQGTEAAALCPGTPLDSLSPAWKVLLLSDGSVTRHLQLLTGAVVDVVRRESEGRATESQQGTGEGGAPPIVLTPFPPIFPPSPSFQDVLDMTEMPPGPGPGAPALPPTAVLLAGPLLQRRVLLRAAAPPGAPAGPALVYAASWWNVNVARDALKARERGLGGDWQGVGGLRPSPPTSPRPIPPVSWPAHLGVPVRLPVRAVPRNRERARRRRARGPGHGVGRAARIPPVGAALFVLAGRRPADGYLRSVFALSGAVCGHSMCCSSVGEAGVTLDGWGCWREPAGLGRPPSRRRNRNR